MIAPVDPDNEPGDLDALKRDLTAAVTADKPAEDPAPTAPKEDDLPEKYQGKSAKEIAEMHMNAEKRLGQLGNDVGQKNKLIDELLDLKRREDLMKGGADEDEIADEPIEVSTNDLLDDPAAALTRVVDKRLESRQKREAVAREKETQAALEKEFADRHPDAEEYLNDEKFLGWLQESPGRVLLAKAAVGAGNLYAANALLDEYKGMSKATDPDPDPAPAAQDNPLAKAKAAATTSAGSTSASDAPTGKKYRRADLVRLKLTDPEAYADPSFQNEIMRAYAEGRVI